MKKPPLPLLGKEGKENKNGNAFEIFYLPSFPRRVDSERSEESGWLFYLSAYCLKKHTPSASSPTFSRGA
jgi:hypothetical protein